MMNDLITDRTPTVIEVEINTIRHQTGKVLLAAAIEIGRHLKETKNLLQHGEWLEDFVSYTERTAKKLMRIFDAYGPQQPVSLDAGA